jgi:hypothetical protein
MARKQITISIETLKALLKKDDNVIREIDKWYKEKYVKKCVRCGEEYECRSSMPSRVYCDKCSFKNVAAVEKYKSKNKTKKV